MNTGPIPPNASELILSPRMTEFIQDARKIYEYIIIDTPPIGILSDAVVLTKNADINLYVLKANFAKRRFVEAAHEIHANTNLSNLCFVLNGVKRSIFNYGYGQDYGYGAASTD